ncbi:HAD family hydrolase [Bradyrhizobium sp. SZCCHNR1020]|uniref:HAD family hydrolase n=1 Tax=Bradyrhizobium sp. SZCCHNR1020 TaxID=3057343 RepID=UPI002916FEBA|nr:HAD hydrolase-like protein [Bradyrhizobium sp. SZCCHNR1020]
METYLFTDADNTLWNTDAVFAAAQLDMLHEIERITGRNAPADEDRGLAFLRNLDQRIAAAHPDYLRYPSGLLAYGLALVLEGEEVEEVVVRVTNLGIGLENVYEAAQARFLDSIQRLPPLREGVREGLLAISEANIAITIVTEERVERCRQFLAGHRLENMVTDVISVRKTTEAYLELRRNAATGRYFMVGDQMDRDILAAAAAGYSTFYFPGDFAPYWASELDTRMTRRIDRYDAIVPDVLAETY